jgi:hypothetical protein
VCSIGFYSNVALLSLSFDRMAVFVDNPCRVDNDTIIDIITWGTCDTIAALATSRLDENDKEKFQVLFVNDEVRKTKRDERDKLHNLS